MEPDTCTGQNQTPLLDKTRNLHWTEPDIKNQKDKGNKKSDEQRVEHKPTTKNETRNRIAPMDRSKQE